MKQATDAMMGCGCILIILGLIGPILGVIGALLAL